VPQLVRPTPLVGWPPLPSDRGPGRPEIGQQTIDRVVVERVDLPAGELGRQALRVPVGQQAHDDDRLLDPPGQARRSWAAGSIEEGLETTRRISGPPTMEARPAGSEGEGRCDALLLGDADAPGPQSEADQVRTWRWARRSAAASRQEEEVRPFLVGMPKETTVRIGPIVRLELIHAVTLGPAINRCLNIPGNHT